MATVLSYTLQLGAGGFINPLKAAQGALRGLLSAGSQAGNVLTGLASAKGILDGIVDTLKKPITLAADMESMNAEFAVMLGSGAKAKALLGDLRQFANVTPFGTAGLASNAKTLLAFGVASDQVVPTLKMLGDIAGTSQEKLDSLTLAFSQATSAGKLQGQDLLQLINAGFNPLQEMARTTGRSMVDLREDMEKGNITADMMAAAFRSATSAGGRFFGNTSAQSRVFAGLASTLGDAWDEFLRRFGAPVASALKPVLIEATDLLGRLAPIAGSIGENLAGGLTAAFAVIKGGDLGKVIGLSLTIAFKEAVNNYVAAFTAGTTSFGPLLQKVLGIGIGFLGKALPALGAGFAGIFSGILSGLGKGIALVLEALTDPQTLEGFKVSFLAIITAVKAELLDVFGQILGHIPGKGALGKEMQALAGSNRNLASAQGIQAGIILGNSNSRIGRALGGVAENVPTSFDFGAALKTIAGAALEAKNQFSAAYAAAPKVFDTTAERGQLGSTIASDVRKLTQKPIPVQIINQQGANAGSVF
jgi:tape measure domain-containing protein